MNLAASLDPFPNGDRRAGHRRPIDRDSTVRNLQDGIARDVLVRDLSCDGFGLNAEIDLVPGTMVSVGLPSIGTRVAMIVRRDADRYGCRFFPPITPLELSDAFVNGEVVHAFIGCASAHEHYEPVVPKWHPAVRLSVIIILVTTTWGAVVSVLLS